MTPRRLLGSLVLVACIAGVLYGLQVRVAGLPALSTLLDPVDGLYRTARQAPPATGTTQQAVPGLSDSVTVVRDERGVPHIFASSDRAATIALGYVAAQDRLFQLDFLPRVASGRLAEAFGPRAVDTDRFLRRTGMEWGAQKNLERIRAADGIEHDALRWYGQGVNAVLDQLDRSGLPLEFRLLGYTPDRYTPIQGLRLLQYMTFDLTYNSDDPSYAQLRDSLSDTAYRRLYPEHPVGLYEPIVPPGSQLQARSDANDEEQGARAETGGRAALRARANAQEALGEWTDLLRSHPGTGSNNWAVSGARSESGAPLLAGDMHLSLSLPSVWYEVHVVTPTMNAYGLTIPGAPVLVQAFNRHVGWTLTNTGADQIDHYALALDSTGTRYRFNGEWRDLRRKVDTIRVNRGPPVLDTLVFSHHGPVHEAEAGGQALAERWVAHDSSRTLRALWHMNRASSTEEVTDALQAWDTPMQNVLYAGQDGDIVVRSAGYLPLRKNGDGRGLLDGTTDAAEWVGRVPFDSLPGARNPEQGFLASANQVPTGPDYPYYLGHDWGDGYRSLRINQLLRASERHGVDDFERYQTDVQAQQRKAFVPLLQPLDDLSPRADTLRRMLRRWDGAAEVDRREPLVMDVFLRALRRLAWDEAVFATAPDPEDAVLLDLLQNRPSSRWLDIQATDPTEDAAGLLSHTLEAAADTMASRYGWAPTEWRWGDHHVLRVDHISGIESFEALGRGPFEMPGFAATLFPGRGRTVTHSASQRVIIDFSTTPPTGRGIYPGGQSGRPLDPETYDSQLAPYLDGTYYEYQVPAAPAELEASQTRSVLRLVPVGGE